MRYLITGATGFIGRRLVHHLVEHGHDVTALVRRELRLPGVRLTYGDLATGAGLDAAVQDAEHVIHLAGVTKAPSSAGYAEVNTEGTRRLCTALARLPRPPRLVYCSSLAAVGPGRQRRADEEPTPVSAYGRSKLGGEHALREIADRVPGVIVRPPIVYGPGDHGFLPHLVTAVRTGFLPAVGRPGPRHYSLIHVDDLCRALLAAAGSGAPGAVYHVSDGTEHRWDHIGATVATTLGRRPPRVVHIPVPLARAAARTVGMFGTYAFNRDKVNEARQPAWTCVNGSSVGQLRFAPAVSLADGLTTALAPYTRP
ncbi:NAD-dependent epimerase/dehydratase family protein [Streptomyces gobiensis]|uniref:NAD-dependent epimerase/dehydratase family protein n=1 Tax=Streptomyces gobiensis TaxID=2875706 RepID=UPI001E5BD95D|nr:NAD(P)-dependent oxidoreductase [Streptomyces gobiensis]UGY91521.1 NAD(P)-dependent oxidoreductase [Streptomyces gobiensis]